MVRRLKSLSTRTGREEQSTLLLEGTHLLQEALKKTFAPREVIATSSWIKENQSIISSLPEDCVLRQVSDSVLLACLTTKKPDGVASILPLSALPKITAKEDFVLALDRIQDPGNIGTLFRTALAADIDCILLALGADPLSQKVMRSSAGAVLHLPFLRYGSTENIAIKDFVDKLEDFSGKGHQIVASVAPQSKNLSKIIPYWDLDWSKPTVLVLGNEGAGLHPLVKACCTEEITLPHSKQVESLNVASAAVPMLFERRRSKIVTKCIS